MTSKSVKSPIDQPKVQRSKIEPSQFDSLEVQFNPVKNKKKIEDKKRDL